MISPGIPEGTTPLDDISHLLVPHIDTKTQLNEFESRNISKATRKYLSRPRKYKITVGFIKKVHKEMFNETWDWAGKLRTSELNMGVSPAQIQVELYKLEKDIELWEKENIMDVFQRGVMIHHRLVKIHPFTNGNGRHARLVSDIYLYGHGCKLPAWPDRNLIESTDIRSRYIAALKEADNGNYELLTDFTKELIK